MKIIFTKLILSIIALLPKGKFAPVTYWRHQENKHLYICMSEKQIHDEPHFLQVFPKAIRTSKFEFDSILFFDPTIEIVTVADDNILLMISSKQ